METFVLTYHFDKDNSVSHRIDAVGIEQAKKVAEANMALEKFEFSENSRVTVVLTQHVRYYTVHLPRVTRVS